jgi:hypothetical protein
MFFGFALFLKTYCKKTNVVIDNQCVAVIDEGFWMFCIFAKILLAAI